jgi:hypothetical protein
MLWSENILDLFKHLEITTVLPAGVVVLNPYKEKGVFQLCEKFYQQYYNDNKSRKLIIGINPGRFGGGLTGIPFTDPVKLENICGIPNKLKKKSELSSDFIYQIIESMGGPSVFYSNFYFSSVSPLGFTMNGKNLNYYDVPKLQSSLLPFIKSCLGKQIKFGIDREVCFILGEGKNFAFMNKLNDEIEFFKKIVPLSHPRFILQYKRKKLNQYIQDYKRKLSV